MKNWVWLLKILTITLVFLLFLSFLAVKPAYSRGGGGGGCFGGETLILTPNGSRTIKQLSPGDKVINYNFSTHHQEEGTIGNIEIIPSTDYYLINHQTQVTRSHPFYRQIATGIKLTEVQNLKQGDLLITPENSLSTISSIEHITKPISVYNLISINPNNNFYADGFLVHNKGAGGGGSFVGGHGYGGGTSSPIHEKTLPGLIKAFIILVALWFPFVYWQQIYNFIHFSGKKFTDAPQLIEFATHINANFTNKYSIWYLKDDQIWQGIPPQSELPESQYQHLITQEKLIAQVSQLFLQYQHDWTFKDFESMTQYILEPFYSQQKHNFQKSFGNNFDIVSDCKFSRIIPLALAEKEEESIFRVQINAEMINFKVSVKGYILRGEPYPRSFSEYWDIRLDSENNCYLIKITQVTLQG